MIRLLSMGDVHSAWSIVYSSPTWFNWSGPGTLRLLFRGSLSPYQMPLPTWAVASPFLIHDLSVYMIIGGFPAGVPLGARSVMSVCCWDGSVKTWKQSFRDVLMLKGFRVMGFPSESSLSLLSSWFGLVSFGFGFVKNSGGCRIIGFHLSFIVPKRFTALSMHLLGCLHAPLVFLLMLVHFAHLHFLFLLWLFRMLVVISAMSCREWTQWVFFIHFPNLLLSMSGFSGALVWMFLIAGSVSLMSGAGWIASILTLCFLVILSISLRSFGMSCASGLLSSVLVFLLLCILECHVWRNWFILMFGVFSSEVLSPGTLFLRISSAR